MKYYYNIYKNQTKVRSFGKAAGLQECVLFFNKTLQKPNGPHKTDQSNAVAGNQ
jgi:hypothetical protein